MWECIRGVYMCIRVYAVNLKNAYTPKKMRLYMQMYTVGYTFAYTDVDVLCHLYSCIHVYIHFLKNTLLLNLFICFKWFYRCSIASQTIEHIGFQSW